MPPQFAIESSSDLILQIFFALFSKRGGIDFWAGSCLSRERVCGEGMWSCVVSSGPASDSARVFFNPVLILRRGSLILHHFFFVAITGARWVLRMSCRIKHGLRRIKTRLNQN